MAAAETANIEKTSFSRKVRRVFGLDLHSWEQLMLLSLGVAGLIALAVFLTTASVVILQRDENAKTKAEFEEYKLDAAKLIAGANAAGDAARADAAQANARALEAKLELERFKAPRHINGGEFVAALEGKPRTPVEIVFVRDNPECWQLAMQIRDWLKTAKWTVSEPAAISGPDEPRFDIYPSAMQAGGQPSGVVIVQRATSQDDFERERHNPFDPDAPIDTPRKALSHALMASLGSIGGSMSFTTGTIGMLRIVVGPKP